MLVSAGKTALKRYGFDDSDPLLTWLNAGMWELFNASDWAFLKTEANVAVALGVGTPTLPSDVDQVISVRDITTSYGPKLKLISQEEWERFTDTAETGNPSYYTTNGAGEGIDIYPIPDSARTLRVVYNKAMTEMSSDAAEMPGPARIHYTIVRAAAFIALQAENEEERAETAQAQFEADLSKLFRRYGKTELDEPQQVADVMGYGGV